MKRRTLSLVLACALSVALLSACGGKGSDGSVSGSSSGSLLPDGSVSSSASEGPAQPDTSAPDQSQPDTSSPDGSQSDAVQEPSATASLSLNKNSFTLSKAGATYRLKYTLSPEGGKVTFSSSDEKVATVNDKGTVTAVAPGSAVITVTSGKLTAQCTVKCSWKAAEKPAESAKPSAPSQSAQDKLPSQEEKAVDLAAFFTKIEKDYDMSSMEAADSELIENCYPGLSAIQTQQLAVYMCMMNPSPNGDVVLVQVKDSKDVDAVKAILQARIQYMVGDGNGPGGAWYPEPTEMWENNSRIVTHGNYVMMVADFECENIVNAFNALF